MTLEGSADATGVLQDRIIDAVQKKTPLEIRGGITKRFLGRPTTGTPLDVRIHRGIVRYDPNELVLTARAGTALADIEHALAEHGQMMPFEPPHFGPDATFGGMVASGLSGPRRPWSGAVRDFVLGCRLIDGNGRSLRFGGEVMKNVAGYDMSRLMVGSLGCLGVLTEISIKVLPLPRGSCTMRLSIEWAEAQRRLNGWRSKPLPITGACHDGHALYLRVEGGPRSVSSTAQAVGGETVDSIFWDELREQRLPFFSGEAPLWRLSVPATAPSMELPGTVLHDWAGAQRWLRSTADSTTIRRAAAANGGHATAYRGFATQPFHPLTDPLLSLHKRLKASLDPATIFNPGRMFADL